MFFGESDFGFGRSWGLWGGFWKELVLVLLLLLLLFCCCSAAAAAAALLELGRAE